MSLLKLLPILYFSTNLLSYLAKLLGKLLRAHVLKRFGRAEVLGGGLIPFLEFQNFQSLLHLCDLCLDGILLLGDEGES